MSWLDQSKVNDMNNYFVPYTGKKPASVCINGHRLVILTVEKDVLEDDLELIGADRIRKVRVKGLEEEQEKLFGRLARQVDGGVVLAPSGIDLREILQNLEEELPWVH